MNHVNEDADKIIWLLENFPKVYESVEEKKAVESAGGEKITWPETVSLVMEHGKDALYLVSNLKEMALEAKDYEAADAEEVNEQLTKLFNSENPYAREGAAKANLGVGNLKEGIELLVKAHKWEKENK